MELGVPVSELDRSEGHPREEQKGDQGIES
jgi:hypothetical protein